jgi:WD40 repeat protein
MGGVSGGLARRAEEIFDSLSEEEKDAARQLFLRLVVFGEGTEDTLRRILRAELLSLQTDPSGMHAALDAFGRARLLSFDRDTETRGPTVEVAHAALLREWSRLREWIDTDREDLRTERWLAASARDWNEAGRDSSYLISGSRLQQLEAWKEKTNLAVAPEEREFLEASIAQRDRRQAGEAARRARERTLERRSLRRLRALVAVLTVAALISGGLTVFASSQRGRAERQERIAVARELASAAVANLDEDPERSILLALQAVDQTRSVDGSVAPEAEDALHRAVAASRIELRVPNVGGGLDWSPRGNTFATEGPEESGLVDIRDAATGDSVLSFQGHDVDVNLVAFSDDGSMLATTGDDGAAKVWDPATGQKLWAFKGPAGQVWGPSFSPDGSLLAAAWWNESVVRVWDLTTGRMVHEIGPLDATFVTSFSPDGRRLAIPTGDSGALVVDVGSGEKVFALKGQSFGVSDVDWSPDGRWIATSSPDSTVRIWEADTGRPRFTLFGHSAGVVAADWSPDSTQLVTGSSDGTAKVWEITEEGTREVLSLSAQERGGGLWVAFSPDGQRVMTGDQEITAVKIWDVSTSGDQEWANLPAASEEPSGVAFTPDGRQVVAGSGAGSVTMWDAETAERSLKIGGDPASPDPAREILAVDVSPDGRLIAAAGSVARVWDARTGDEVFAVRSAGGVEDAAWNSDGTLLATASSEGLVKIVDRSGLEKSVLRGDPGFGFLSVRFSPDGRLLATARVPTGRLDPTSSEVALWDWVRGDIVTRIGVVAEGLAFDPTGRRIATGPLFGPAKVWDTDSGRQVATLAGHTGAIFDIDYSLDGARIATASADGTVRLWDSDSGVQTLVLRGHKSVVWDVAFSPDGSKLASSSSDGTVRVWALDLDDLIAIAKRELTRGLTEEECRQYLHTDRCG